MPSSSSAYRSRCGMAGSDSEGAFVRAHQLAGQSWGGRQGAVFLSRCDPRLTRTSRCSTNIRTRAFPYADLVAENARRGTDVRNTSCSIPASSLRIATSTCSSNTRKSEPGDILMKITAWNRGPDAATLHLMPQLVLRNTWSWEPGAISPRCTATASPAHRDRAGRAWRESSVLRRRRGSVVHRKRIECAAAVESGQSRLFQGRLSRTHRRCEARLRQSSQHRHQGGIWYHSMVAARRHG